MALGTTKTHRGLTIEGAYCPLWRIVVDRFTKTIAMSVRVYADEQTRRSSPEQFLSQEDYTIHDTPEVTRKEIEYDPETKEPVEKEIVVQEASTKGSDAVAAYQKGTSLDAICYAHLKGRHEWAGAKDV